MTCKGRGQTNLGGSHANGVQGDAGMPKNLTADPEAAVLRKVRRSCDVSISPHRTRWPQYSLPSHVLPIYARRHPGLHLLAKGRVYLKQDTQQLHRHIFVTTAHFWHELVAAGVPRPRSLPPSIAPCLRQETTGASGVRG